MDSEHPPADTPPPDAWVPDVWAPWVHRSWCAAGCEFPPGAMEGAHLGAPWVLTPAEEQTGRVALRLVEDVTESGTGAVRVLVSVTERRLAGDLDPFDEFPEQPGGGLADITSSAGLGADEAGRVVEQLVAFARCAHQLGSVS